MRWGLVACRSDGEGVTSMRAVAVSTLARLVVALLRQAWRAAANTNALGACLQAWRTSPSRPLTALW